MCAVEEPAVFFGDEGKKRRDVELLAAKMAGRCLGNGVQRHLSVGVGACWEKMGKRPILRGGDLAGAAKKL